MPVRRVTTPNAAVRVMDLSRADSASNVEAVLARVVDHDRLRTRSGGKVPDNLITLDAVLDEDEPAARAALDAIAEGRVNLLLMEDSCREET